jgi:hypothetical protein
MLQITVSGWRWAKKGCHILAARLQAALAAVVVVVVVVGMLLALAIRNVMVCLLLML